MPDVPELSTVVFMKATFNESSLFEKHRGEYLVMIITILSKMNYLHNLNRRCDLRNCGLRRSRVAANGQGKRGGARVIYY